MDFMFDHLKAASFGGEWQGGRTVQLESLENVDFNTPPFLVVLKTLISTFSEPFLLYKEVKKIICPFFSKYVIINFFHFLANEGPSGTDFGGAKIGDTPLPQGG